MAVAVDVCANHMSSAVQKGKSTIKIHLVSCASYLHKLDQLFETHLLPVTYPVNLINFCHYYKAPLSFEDVVEHLS